MVSELFCSLIKQRRQKWRILMLGALCWVVGTDYILADGTDNAFFATKSLSKVSLIQNADRHRVSLGPTPPSTATKRYPKRDVPANQLNGLRKFKSEKAKVGEFRPALKSSQLALLTRPVRRCHNSDRSNAAIS
jgi:hypothetical protein